MQELQTINMQMRIITEDNIEQMENMSYSKNISKLLMNPGANEETVAEMVKTEGTNRLNAKNANVPKYLESISPSSLNEPLPQLLAESPSEPPPYPDVSPAYEPPPDSYPYPDDSYPYPDVSPAYEPTSAELAKMGTDSSSPVYNPNMEKHDKVWEEWRKYFDPKEQRMTHRFDEATKTWIKTKTFDEIWGLKGGNPAFQVGEHVYLRGREDNTQWTVKHIGDKFITVENRDPHYMGGEDTIQVVETHELLRPSEVNRAEGLSFDKPVFSQIGGIKRHSDYHNDPNNGKIVFAPQIVVTTGNDNNMTIPAGSSSPELSNSGQSGSIGEPSVSRNISMAKMEPAKMGSFIEPEEKREEPQSSGGGGLLDFAKGFFIKKMT
jgi:hypothetical protein